MGHLKYLMESKKLCDKLIVAINSDESVKKIKGRNRPVNDEQSRSNLLASLSFCDHVIIFKEKTPLKLINTLKPSIITKGGDYKKENVVGYKECKKWNGQISIISFIKGVSTTKIIKKINKTIS